MIGKKQRVDQLGFAARKFCDKCHQQTVVFQAGRGVVQLQRALDIDAVQSVHPFGIIADRRGQQAAACVVVGDFLL